jgi:hypothetical protein
MFRASARATGALLAILAVASCNGSDTTAPPPRQSIDISLSAAQLTVMCGNTGITTATLTRGGDYAGTVAIAVSGLPAGVTAFLSPSELGGSATSATIMMAAAETVLPGSYTITVTASSSIGTAAATYQLIIVDTPHFHMSVEPSTLTVAAGMSGTATVNIARRGDFTGEVELSADNPTPGLTVSFDPAKLEGTSAIVMVRAASTVPEGNYTFTVAGNGQGVPPATARLSVHVKALPTDWYVVAEPSELTVTRGSSGHIEVHVVTDVEFPGWANYSLVNPPAGISADFEYHYDWGYPATMTIFVPSTVAAGQYALTLATACPGLPTKTITIGLTVKDP